MKSDKVNKSQLDNLKYFFITQNNQETCMSYIYIITNSFEAGRILLNMQQIFLFPLVNYIILSKIQSMSNLW